MTSYETLFIVRPDIDEDDLNKVVGRVEDVVKSNEGTIVESQVWGKKRLAYEVKKCTEGIYIKINFDAPPAVVEKLRDHFRFNEDVIRDLVVRDERRQIEPAPVADEAAPAAEDVAEQSTQTDTAPVEDESAVAVKETGQVAETEEAAEVKAEDEAAPPEEEVGEVGEEGHTQQQDSEG